MYLHTHLASWQNSRSAPDLIFMRIFRRVSKRTSRLSFYNSPIVYFTISLNYLSMFSRDANDIILHFIKLPSNDI